MAGKMNVTVVLAVLVVVAMVATTSFVTVEARPDLLSSILGSIGGESESLPDSANKGTAACCDQCFCTRSLPPQCQCADQKRRCHSECKLCRCTRSSPPTCRCMDIDDFCYPKCSSSSEVGFINGNN